MPIFLSLSNYFKSTGLSSRKINYPAFRRLVLLAAIMLLPVLTIQACEIHFNISGEKKEVYKAGDTFILEVNIVYTHRECEIKLSDTKFLYKGIKILGATPWKESTPTSFTRQIKIQVTDEPTDEVSLTLVRKCSKEGAIGKFNLKKA